MINILNPKVSPFILVIKKNIEISYSWGKGLLKTKVEE